MTTRVDLSDEELLQRLRDADEEACALAVRRHAGRMLATARRLLRPEAEAGAAVREAFLAVLRAAAERPLDVPLPIALHRATLEAALARMRRRGIERERGVETMLPAFDDAGHHARPVAAWREEAAGADARVPDRRDCVRRAVDRLPPAYRTVLLLRDVEERSTEETARLLGTTPSAVKVRLHRARQAVRELIDPEMVA